MREHVLKLEKYGIDSAMYNELKWFCRQHRTRKTQLNNTRIGFNNLSHEEIRSSDPTDPTARRAARALHLRNEIDALENAAQRAADPVMVPYIVRNAVDNVRHDKLMPPCGQNQFYAMRQLFFYYLAVNLGKVQEK